MEGEKLLIHHTAKTKDDFQNSTEKDTEIIEKIASNYKVNRRVYQSHFLILEKICWGTFIRLIRMKYNNLTVILKRMGEE